MLHCRRLTGFWICLRFWVSHFLIYLCSKCARVMHMPLVLNMPGFWIYQGSEYAAVTHRVLSMPKYFLDMSCTLLNQLCSKVISKNVILAQRKALWSSLKLWRKVENCSAIVKKIYAAGFLTHFDHFSLPYNFFMLIWALDPWCSMLETLRDIQKI